MSLLDQLTEVVASQMTQSASKRTGLSEGAAAQLMPMAMAVLMNGLKKNAADPTGAEALSKALDHHDGSLLNNVARMGDTDVVSDGEKILGHVFGAKRGQLEAALAKAGGGGIDQDQIGKLLAMAAPAVLASLGRAKREQGLDGAALAGLLTEESHRAQASFGDQLGGALSMFDTDGDGKVSQAEAMGAGAKLLGGLFGKKR